MKNRGFTLIELLITLAIAAILASVAVPAFSAFLARHQQASDVNELISILSFARSEAIKQRQPILVNFLPPDECLDTEGIGANNESRHWCYQVERKDDGETMRLGQSANITAPDQAFSLIFQSLGDADIDGCGASSCNVTLTPQRDNIDPVTLVINTAGSIRRGQP